MYTKKEKIPKYVLQNQRLKKNKTEFVFRRNFLSLNDFNKRGCLWVFEENFTHCQSQCRLQIRVHDSAFSSINNVDIKGLNTYKMEEYENYFVVSIKAERKSKNFKIIRRSNNVEVILEHYGGYIPYENKYDNRNYRRIIRPESRVAVDIPKSVLYNARHPYYGGCFSPR